MNRYFVEMMLLSSVGLGVVNRLDPDRTTTTSLPVKDEREEWAKAIARSNETRQQRRNRERLAQKGRTP